MLNQKIIQVLGMVAVCCFAAQTRAAEVLTNGDFETGDFTGWTATSASNDGGCGDDWSVSPTGSTCSSVGGGVAGGGGFSAYNSFDGPGPIQYRLTQTFLVPANITTASLAWLQSISASAPDRSFTVELADVTDTVIHGIISNQVIPNGTSTPWTPFANDLTALLQAHEGETVTLAFTSIIPQTFTGPGGLGLDNVSLDVVTGAAPAPPAPPKSVPTMGIWGIGTLAGMIGLLGMYHRRRN